MGQVCKVDSEVVILTKVVVTGILNWLLYLTQELIHHCSGI